MIGHQQIIDMRRNRMKPTAVFVHMSEPPMFADANSIYVGDKPKTTENLFFLKDISQVHLIPSDNAQNVVSWWCAIADAQPKFLITVFEGELTTWNP